MFRQMSCSETAISKDSFNKDNLRHEFHVTNVYTHITHSQPALWTPSFREINSLCSEEFSISIHRVINYFKGGFFLCFFIHILCTWMPYSYKKQRCFRNKKSFLWRCDPTRAMASSFLRFLDPIRRITDGSPPLDEWSARRRDLYSYNTQHSQETDIHAPGGARHGMAWHGMAWQVGFEPTISAGERPHTHALHRAASGNGFSRIYHLHNWYR